MKRLSYKQSRKNSTKREHRVASRHAQAGHWREQPQPMMSGGKVHYEIGATIDATSYGGLASAHRLVSKLGLPRLINRRVKLLKRHLPYHESDHVLNLAYNVLCGGTRLEDIERLRHDVAYMNMLGADLIPDPTTAGDFCRRFDEQAVTDLMECINAVRPELWRRRGKEIMDPITYIDADGTIVGTCGEQKAGMQISYKGIWGYAPLIISLANTKEVLYVVNRPGNAVSHHGAAEWIDRSIELVSPHVERMCLRGDTDFSLTANFDRWAERVDFLFGMDANAKLVGLAQEKEESAWKCLQRKEKQTPLTPTTRERYQVNEKERIVIEREYLNHEEIAEFSYRPGKCKRDYRVVALRKNITKMKGQRALFDEIRYFFYITTRTDISAEEVVRCANQRCDQENIIEELKNGVNALRVPLYDLTSNWAYMVIAALAWNIKSWVGLMMHRKQDRRYYIDCGIAGSVRFVL